VAAVLLTWSGAIELRSAAPIELVAALSGIGVERLQASCVAASRRRRFEALGVACAAHGRGL
jgi:hypothetical protein